MTKDLLSDCRFTAHGMDCLVRVYPDVVCGYVVIQDEKHPLWGCGEGSPRVQALLSGGVTYARILTMDGWDGWGIGFHSNGGNLKKDFVDAMAQCRTLAEAIRQVGLETV